MSVRFEKKQIAFWKRAPNTQKKRAQRNASTTNDTSASCFCCIRTEAKDVSLIRYTAASVSMLTMLYVRWSSKLEWHTRLSFFANDDEKKRESNFFSTRRDSYLFDIGGCVCIGGRYLCVAENSLFFSAGECESIWKKKQQTVHGYRFFPSL